MSSLTRGYAPVTLVARKIVPLLVALAVNTPAFAQSCPAVHVSYPDGNYIIPGVRGDIRYAGDLALDAYVQPGADRRPSVVVIHGGTWSSGSRVAHVGQILEVLTRAGYNWFSVDYRLGGLKRFEESVADIRASLAWIRCRSGELGIDPARLIPLGEDSGAQLAAMLAARRIPGVIGAVLVGGFYDLTATPGTMEEGDVALLARASPTTHVVSKMPPLLLVHGSADGEAPIEQAQRYCRAVVQAEGGLPGFWRSRGQVTGARTGGRASGTTSVKSSRGSQRSGQFRLEDNSGAQTQRS